MGKFGGNWRFFVAIFAIVFGYARLARAACTTSLENLSPQNTNRFQESARRALLYEKYLAPGKILSSNFFRAVVKKRIELVVYHGKIEGNLVSEGWNPNFISKLVRVLRDPSIENPDSSDIADFVGFDSMPETDARIQKNLTRFKQIARKYKISEAELKDLIHLADSFSRTLGESRHLEEENFRHRFKDGFNQLVRHSKFQEESGYSVELAQLLDPTKLPTEADSITQKEEKLVKLENLAKEYGVSVAELLELFSSMQAIQNSPEKTAEFKNLIAEIHPKYIKNLEERVTNNSNLFYSRSPSHSGGALLAGSLLGYAVFLVSPLVGGTQELGAGIGTAGVFLPMLAQEGYRQYLHWRSWWNEAKFRSEWKKAAPAPSQKTESTAVATPTKQGPNLATLDAFAAHSARAQTAARVNVAQPYKELAPTIAPARLPLEDLNDGNILEFAEPLRKSSHRVMEETARRLSSIFDESKWRGIQKVTASILADENLNTLSKVEAANALSPFIDEMRNSLLPSMRDVSTLISDVRSLKIKFEDAMNEISLTQEVLLDNAEKYISAKADIENLVLQLEKKKEELYAERFALLAIESGLASSQRTLEKQHQVLGSIPRTVLSSGKIGNLRLSQEGIQAIRTLSRLALSPSSSPELPKLLLSQVEETTEEKPLPPKVQVNRNQ